MEREGTLHGALEGIRVVDMTQALAGPYLGMLLGDLGADVIKLERPGVGDQSRGWGPPFAAGESAYFLSINRNKRSLTCDYSTKEGLEVLRRLVERADVLLTNERRESYRVRMGIDYPSLSARNPRIIYCSITGFGMTGPYAGRPGYDIIAQGMAGLMPITGEKEEVPMRYPASIADLATALYGLGSVLAALFVRERTGRGQYIDLSLLESQAWWGVTQAVAYLLSGRPPAKLGNDHPFIVPYGTFKAKDGYLIIACASEALWARLCAVLGLEEIRDDPRYHINRERVVRRAEVRRIIEEKLAERNAAEWIELLEQAGVPAGPIYSIPEMLQDAHVRARGFVIEQAHPTVGTLRTLASPLHLNETPASYRLPPPLLGQHTDEILAELGFSADDIRNLRDTGAV
jgi:crotonobetainyl-CoA:carnitine CoA-transferase CaiB-like acyl-CoA transferase